jgi:hypothetical protein
VTDKDAGFYGAGIVLLLIAGFAALIFYCSGCCWVCRNQRSCFPNCPPPTAVQVERPCTLPPVPPLPDVVTLQSGTLTCFDPQNAKLLALRMSRMKGWIKESLAACPQEPASTPASISTKKVIP